MTRAYGDELSQRTDTIPPLMEIITAIIGDDIEASVMEELRANRPLNSDDSSFEVEEDDEEDETDIIDRCYERIPEHLRRCEVIIDDRHCTWAHSHRIDGHSSPMPSK